MAIEEEAWKRALSQGHTIGGLVWEIRRCVRIGVYRGDLKVEAKIGVWKGDRTGRLQMGAYK